LIEGRNNWVSCPGACTKHKIESADFIEIFASLKSNLLIKIQVLNIIPASKMYYSSNKYK
jgi:hypothetical protein